jgi:serine/threonine-protein kinase
MAKRDKEYQRFREIRQLGVGAFGRAVLVVDQEKENREVVIKVPHDKTKEKALLTEIINVTALNASLTGMSHPNIVRCLGFDLFQDYYVMILEYVDGTDLRKVVGPFNLNREPMKTGRALEVFQNVGRGLVAAHKLKLLHRDIKPENILVRQQDGVAKLTDFGISTIARTTSVGSGTVAGTFPYMAPEVLAGKCSVQSDIWSLAVTLYEMLTGRLPFFDDNLFALKEQIEKKDPVPPVKLNSNVDAKLSDFVMRGLEKSPANRFRSAQEMLDGFFPNLDELLERAWLTYQGGQETEAERTVRDLLSESPHEPRLYIALGKFASSGHRYPQAEEILRRGLSLCPHDAALKLNLAPVLWARGKQREAMAMIKVAINLGLSGAQAMQAKNLLDKWANQREGR